MTTMPVLRDILNDTPANAVDVDYNFGVVETHIGSELINRDGSVAMTQPLLLSGPAPSQPTHAVPKSYVDTQVIPIGTIWMHAATAAPAGWALCDGATKTTTDPAYAALFAVIGYTYGGSGGSFILPNLQGRFPVGRQDGHLGAADPAFDNLNDKGGTKDTTALLNHFHTMAHTHDMNNHQHVVPAHNHGGASVAAGGHNHPAADAVDTFFAHGRLGDIAHQGAAPGTANTFADLHNLVTGSVGDHAHGINGEAAAWTNQINNNTTTGASNSNTSAAALGTAANANLPPYITLNFIIRIGV